MCFSFSKCVYQEWVGRLVFQVDTQFYIIYVTSCLTLNIYWIELNDDLGGLFVLKSLCCCMCSRAILIFNAEYIINFSHSILRHHCLMSSAENWNIYIQVECIFWFQSNSYSRHWFDCNYILFQACAWLKSSPHDASTVPTFSFFLFSACTVASVTQQCRIQPPEKKSLLSEKSDTSRPNKRILQQ